MGVSVRHLGTIKPIVSASVRQGGTIKPVKEIWVRRLGVISKVWPTFDPTPLFTAFAFVGISQDPVFASISFNSNGTVTLNRNGDLELIQNVGYDNSHFIRFTQSSWTDNGDLFGDALGTWHALSSARTRGVTANAPFTFTDWTGVAEISTTASDANVFITAALDIRAFYETGQ